MEAPDLGAGEASTTATIDEADATVTTSTTSTEANNAAKIDANGEVVKDATAANGKTHEESVACTGDVGGGGEGQTLKRKASDASDASENLGDQEGKDGTTASNMDGKSDRNESRAENETQDDAGLQKQRQDSEEPLAKRPKVEVPQDKSPPRKSGGTKDPTEKEENVASSTDAVTEDHATSDAQAAEKSSRKGEMIFGMQYASTLGSFSKGTGESSASDTASGSGFGPPLSADFGNAFGGAAGGGVFALSGASVFGNASSSVFGSAAPSGQGVNGDLGATEKAQSPEARKSPEGSANKDSSSVSPLPTADSPAAGLSPPLGKKVSARQENGEAHEVNITEPTRAKLFKLHIDEAEPNASADGSHQEKEGPAKTTSDGAGALSGNGNDARANEGTWKCLGVGELRVKKSKDGEKMRVVMRREYGRDPKGRNTGGAVSLNLALQKHVLCERVEGDRDFRLTAASSNGNPVTYLIRVRNASDRDRLWRTICDALKSISR
eukprot:g129.t1